ncbi:Predicted O-methyltransferase YrrM [Halobacillus karajensis]|uniref:O-methyltransferase/MSMEI_4947 n=1 Tax=Halobacillus karajensis TaxID=195088 RepID=A0A024P4R0_9BACI|nr:O-methyltransferase [Halobacillus karajensis]CDQ20492.1 Putative O-methyltransferase/MSMEI_4947 [Halobacillus karajensis]CDQ24039.1 Putative O-methyltransferase/MSMEI_4947 [Halobacillus karajensis]CDQ27517.1 Putative O-methyltransferase/MSMEI_4947 [Halobacillus karajensis]SEH90911.1 Predicted O-methyltransferase YrrM [Halobacillus karajensis]
MSIDVWKEIDQYFINQLIPNEPDMEDILRKNEAAELPSIDVSATQGKLLSLFIQMKTAKNVLEIGTLGGYSTIWMAKSLPKDGHVTTLEFSPKHAEVAAKNIADAGVKDKVKIVVGPALESLPTLEGQSFDFIFIDADKNNNPHYVMEVLKLSKPGTTILVDNVVRGGKILDSESEDKSITGIRQMFDLLKGNHQLDATAFQTVGSKGHDGFVLAVVK